GLRGGFGALRPHGDGPNCREDTQEHQPRRDTHETIYSGSQVVRSAIVCTMDPHQHRRRRAQRTKGPGRTAEPPYNFHVPNSLTARRRRVIAALATGVALAGISLLAAPRNFMWKATSPSRGVVYLVGSVHLLTPDYYPLDPAFEEAFKTSDVLVEELDMR